MIGAPPGHWLAGRQPDARAGSRRTGQMRAPIRSSSPPRRNLEHSVRPAAPALTPRPGRVTLPHRADPAAAPASSPDGAPDAPVQDLSGPCESDLEHRCGRAVPRGARYHGGSDSGDRDDAGHRDQGGSRHDGGLRTYVVSGKDPAHRRSTEPSVHDRDPEASSRARRRRSATHLVSFGLSLPEEQASQPLRDGGQEVRLEECRAGSWHRACPSTVTARPSTSHYGAPRGPRARGAPGLGPCQRAHFGLQFPVLRTKTGTSSRPMRARMQLPELKAMSRPDRTQVLHWEPPRRCRRCHRDAGRYECRCLARTSPRC